MIIMKLNNKICIERLVDSKDNNNGFAGESWDDEYYPCWAKVKNINGSEYVEAKATNSESIITFTVRYCNKTKEILIPGNSKIFRVRYNNVYYDIEYPSDFNNSHRYIDLKCKVKK